MLFQCLKVKQEPVEELQAAVPDLPSLPASEKEVSSPVVANEIN